MDETRSDRDGVCICGVPVRRHFTASNEKISCEMAKGRPLDMAGWELIETVASERIDGQRYDLRRDTDGTVGCSCPAFGYRCVCKHVEAYFQRARSEQRV